MSWCDKLSSTPAVGFRLTPHFTETGVILQSLQPILNEMHDDERATFSVESIESFEVTFNTQTGYRYTISPFGASVTFNHRLRAQATSGGPPVMELLSSPAPYTKLLDETIRRLVNVMGLLSHSKDRLIRRIGIVSMTNVDFEDAPPGIQDLIHKIGLPFGGRLEEVNGQFSSCLNEDDNVNDRCVYNLVKPSDESKLTTINLDWQRRYKGPVGIQSSRVLSLLNVARDEALDHFERVAEGGLDD